MSSTAAITSGTVRNLLRQAGSAFGSARHDAALAAYESALVLDPANETALFGKASCLHALGDLPRAAGLFGRLADSHPQKVMYRYNQGYSLLLDAQYDAAVGVLRECSRRIDDPHLKANLAIALEHATQRDLPAARRLLEEAAPALPGDAQVQANLAYLRLMMGDYEAGWRQHERRAILQSAVASTAAPLWQGESLAGKTLLLWHEQGLGDSLQFVRYLPLAAQRAAAEGGKVVFQPPQSLYRLFAYSFAGLAPVAEVLAPDQPVGQFDVHCSLMSLPERMHTTLATVPSAGPYLRADPGAILQWQQRLAGDPNMKVGLVWGGDSRQGHDPIFQRADRRRSTTPEQLSALFKIPGVSCYSLQKGEPAKLGLALRGRDNFFDYTEDLQDFADTAALAANLDLVVTVDTSVCHLAGALGREVWLLNRWDTCWRWMAGRDDSPWYPTLTQYRQAKPGDWSAAISRVANDLRGRSETRSST